MRTLIYKKTHTGDPDPKTGVFGNNDCMGSVRDWQFDAVIGVGGIGSEPKRHGIAGKLNWIGIGPIYGRRDPHSRGPRVGFHHFWYRGEDGPPLQDKYPALASRMYDKNVRSFMDFPSSAGGRLDQDVGKILLLAKAAAASNHLGKQHSRPTRGKCLPKSRRRC
ncbi:MAG: hypothetical protein ACRECV_11650 [Xanthobacteraceae bacterium]